MNKTLIVNRNQCEEILSVEKCLPAMKDALIAVSTNQTKMLQRFMIRHENGNSLANMPASLGTQDMTGAKIIIFPGPETAKAKTQQGGRQKFQLHKDSAAARIKGAGLPGWSSN